jgi:alpha-amylase/alpha-mannosidase (GH57 family)
MHQPFYQDLATGEHILPWVRLHALKDYWGMVALLREFPSMRVTFNLVPSLLVQVQAFARDEAKDRHLELGLKPADGLTDQERTFCVQHFFHASKTRMIDRYPRYAELLARRDSNGPRLDPAAPAGQFTSDEIRDLQVLHKLAWIDPYYLEHEPRVRSLVAMQRGFTEDDKLTLRAVELELLGKVIPEYSDAAARGQVELSTSPFYHPILPLLCDTNVYLRTHAQSRMPRERFQHPEDAALQLTRASTFHERLFDRKPDGLWPSEGSVSDEMVPLVTAAGFRWMATDEGILSRTLARTLTRDGQGHSEQPEVLYKPYRVGPPRGDVACGFRDHTLSDLIGFTYASWPADTAANDFVGRLEEAGRRYAARTSGGDATIFVILDGENAWEHYAGQGRPFLRALYQRVAAHPEIRTVTMSEACASARDSLPSVFPGSWINSDFYIWIGHADDRRAWSQLAEARRALDSAPTGLPDAALATAREELLIAEGSDWFWWYGDDHSSEHDLEFDDLFRRHVQNVYRALDKPVPEDLFLTNITTRPSGVEIERPTGFISPDIDGKVTSYFEWVGAGCADEAVAIGAMHPVGADASSLVLVEFGFDLRHLFLRIDGVRPMAELLGERSGLELIVKFLNPAGVRVTVDMHGGGVAARLQRRTATYIWEPVECGGLQTAVNAIVELRLAFSCLGVVPQDPLSFIVALHREGSEIEHYPRQRAIEVSVPDRDFAAVNWTA